MMKVVGKTHIGAVRSKNQDALLLAENIYGVADGMGGHNGGEVASSKAVSLLQDALTGKDPDKNFLEESVIKVNHDLYLLQEEEESLSGMGTTLTVLWAKPQEIILAHVGDSRAYLLREGEFTQITKDHSIVEEMIAKGMLTKEKARTHPYRNIVTRAVGSAETIEVDMITVERKKRDIWLICSDGLTSMVEEKEIIQIIKENPIEQSGELLLNRALENGGRDNITIVLLQDGEEDNE